MGFWSDVWDSAKVIGKGIADVFLGIAEVLVLTVYAIVDTIFTITEHLYDWIDGVINQGKDISSTVLFSPEDTERFLKTLEENGKGRKVLKPYDSKSRKSMVVATGKNKKVTHAQLTTSAKGYDKDIEEAWDEGLLVEVPVI